jgi:hypothetical protein
MMPPPMMTVGKRPDPTSAAARLMADWSVMPSYRGKRAFDLAIVLLASPIWLPVLLVVAAAVRLRLDLLCSFDRLAQDSMIVRSPAEIQNDDRRARANGQPFPTRSD